MPANVANAPIAIGPWVAESKRDVRAMAARWLATPALTDLLRGFNGPAGVRDLDMLRSWSAATLDTRLGEERRDAAVAGFSDRQCRLLLDSASSLGLIETPAQQRIAYGMLVILGGTTLGNRLRVEMARDIASRTAIGRVVVLTSFRHIRPSEPASPGGEAITHEWQDVLHHVRAAFGGEVRVAEHPREQSLRIPVAGASIETEILVSRDREGRRATTRDQIVDLASDFATTPSSALVVTSAIYAPYQFFATAPVAISLCANYWELVGTSTATRGDERKLAQRFAQEIHATIDAVTLVLTS